LHVNVHLHFTVFQIVLCNVVLELTPTDLVDLYNKALTYNGPSAGASWCYWFYRNRWPTYFADIYMQRQGIMEVYTKDNGGDPASPINGQINGLFFMANNINGCPPRDSQFGEVRLQVPAEVLLYFKNVYFADFYCMRGARHYVTLVVTIPGSGADNFCRERFLLLNLNVNSPFLYRLNGQLYTTNNKTLFIELLYTENVNIAYLVQFYGAFVDPNVPIADGCRGRSQPGGIPKNPICQKCNLSIPHCQFPSM